MGIFKYDQASLTQPTSIKASAGTGKTYTLEHLILRYLTENSVSPFPLDISSILIVTFTEKATREMKERIRRLIQNELKENFVFKNKIYRQRLEKALRDFNHASIHTIHGFCQKTLREFNFYSRLPFDMEHTLDTWYIKDCLWDIFRNEEITPIEYEILQNAFNIKNHEEIIEFIKAYYLEVGDLKYSIIKPPAIENNKINRFKRFLETKDRGTEDAPLLIKKIEMLKSLIKNVDLPKDFVHLPKNIYKEKNIPLYEKELETIANATNYFSLLGHLKEYKNWRKLTFSAINKKLLKKSNPSDLNNLSFYKVLDDIWEEYLIESKELLSLGIALLGKCFNLLEGKIAIHRKESGEQTFKDQILDLERALEESPSLASILSERYQVVLIDEFQDTDSHQWNIFKTAFLDKESPLFLIGDPKQAIYKFRGANLNTYIKAVEDPKITSQGDLTINYRSTPLLIQGFNILFKRLFADTKLDYLDAQFPKDKIFSSSAFATPIDLYFLNNEEKTSFPEIKKKNISFIINEIKIILSGNLKWGLKDIAILTSKNEESRQLRDALNNEGIAASLSNHGSIWRTKESQDILILLKAIHDPTSISRVVTIFFTSFFRINNRQISLIKEKYLSHFQELLSRWKDYFEDKKTLKVKEELFYESFIKNEFKIPSYIKEQVKKIGGERQITNIEHIFELLSQFQMDHNASLSQLINYVEEVTNYPSAEDDNPIRLNTEREAVQILTMHASKGLEFPIVFIHSGIKSLSKGNFPYFEYFLEDKKVFDFNKLLENEQSNVGEDEQKKFQIDELFRLFYVAFTRAKEKLYLPLCQKTRGVGEETELLIFWKKIFLDNPSLENINSLTKQHPDIFQLRKTKEEFAGKIDHFEVKTQTPKLLRPHQIDFKKFLDNYPGMTSFSQLEKNLPESEDGFSSIDKIEMPSSSEEIMGENITSDNIFTFEKGPILGNLIHSILETIDFDKTKKHIHFQDFCRDTAISNLISEQIRIFFDREWEKKWKEFLHIVIWQTLKAPLDFGGERFYLCDLSEKEKIHEVEFIFTVKKTKFSLANFNISDFNNEFYIDRDGYLKGFIDLIFKWRGKYYVADWKSNSLGPSPDYYQEKHLRQAMQEHHYHWQSLIYTVALCRYLSLQKNFDYEKDVGGVCYFFLRGMTTEPKEVNQGVYFHRFDAQEIKQFSERVLRA